MATSIIPATNPAVTSAINSATSAATATTGVDKNTLAGNFQTFLQLLTTQLKNQNPLEPLDTNQFTQQLVQFAQVEQQLKANDQLSKLVALEQTAQSSYALAFVGQTVAVDGATTQLKNGAAVWTLTNPKPATATITVTNETGQTVHSSTYTMSAGKQTYIWDGVDASGLQWPDGNYTISVTALDANGLPVSIPTEIEAPVDAADLSKSPPVLSIAGRDYTVDKVKRVVRH